MNMQNVLNALDIMWKGMGGIFVTILIIMVCVLIMGKLGSKGGKKDNRFQEYPENAVSKTESGCGTVCGQAQPFSAKGGSV